MRRHPWVFSGGVHSSENCENGDIVEVRSFKGEFLGIGYFQEGSIMVRMLSFEEVQIDAEFWEKSIRSAHLLRLNLSLPSHSTNAYRLINGEGDGIPGLIIDIYGNIAVIQCHTTGIFLKRKEIAAALQTHFQDDIDTIYVKSGNTLKDSAGTSVRDHFLLGNIGATMIREYGHTFYVDVVRGQKTGFFLDQRVNRNLLSRFVKGKSVLNLFSYTGGFSVYALMGKATKVVSVDASKLAIELCNQNVSLTDNMNRHEGVVSDVHQYLHALEIEAFDVMIIDPPAYAKSQRKKHNAVQAYKRINAAAIRKIAKGGLIFTFSCSQVIEQPLFENTITAAAIEAGRNCQVLYRLNQSPDHPVNIFHPEGHYLKGLVLKIR